jgi:hypothetical protein
MVSPVQAVWLVLFSGQLAARWASRQLPAASFIRARSAPLSPRKRVPSFAPLSFVVK